MGGEGKRGERIEEGKGRRRNVAFHHLLLSNLTTALIQITGFYLLYKSIHSLMTDKSVLCITFRLFKIGHVHAGDTAWCRRNVRPIQYQPRLLQ